MSHTPGPWRVSSVHTHERSSVFTDAAPTVCVAETWTPQHAANARLIAAAPALYEALKAIVQAEEAAFEEWRANNLPDWVEGHPAFDRYNAARTALSLAEGSEPSGKEAARAEPKDIQKAERS
jgi:hypothetical protein